MSSKKGATEHESPVRRDRVRFEYRCYVWADSHKSGKRDA